MKTFKYFIFFLLLTQNIALADDDCTRETPFPIVDSKSKKISSYKLTKKKSRYIIESFIFLPRQKIEIHQYGCAHFGLQYRFIAASSHFETPLRFVREKLEPLTTVIPDFTPGILSAINSVKKYNISRHNVITVSEGYETIYIQFGTETSKNDLAIIYDIAL